MRRFVTVLGILLLAGCTSIERLALPEPVVLDHYWQRHDPASTEAIDHRPWQVFLDTYVLTDRRGINRVDYGAVNEEGKSALKRYLADLQSVPIVDFQRSEQLAYWVNLYNAKTVDIVLDHYPVASIRDIKLGEGWIVIGPWDAEVLRVAGRPMSLNNIEHGILRPIWQDQRLHYVLNCAAVGCPNLGRTAYDGRTIDDAMTTAARAYVNDPRGVDFNREDGLTLSKIYAWFREDFGANERDILGAIAAFAEPELRIRLEQRRSVDAYGYDWSLNDVRNADALVTANAERVRKLRHD